MNSHRLWLGRGEVSLDVGSVSCCCADDWNFREIEVAGIVQAGHVLRSNLTLGRNLVVDGEQRAGLSVAQLTSLQCPISGDAEVFVGHGSKVVAIQKFDGLSFVGFALDVVSNEAFSLQIAQFWRDRGHDDVHGLLKLGFSWSGDGSGDRSTCEQPHTQNRSDDPHARPPFRSRDCRLLSMQLEAEESRSVRALESRGDRILCCGLVRLNALSP